MEDLREPIFHDRQAVIDQSGTMTSSASFVDIPGATITTVELGQPATYLIWFSVLLSPSVAITLASFRVLVDGVPVAPMARTISLKTVNQDVGFTFMGKFEMEGSKVIQGQWMTDKGTLTMVEFNIALDGIPSVRVIT